MTESNRRVRVDQYDDEGELISSHSFPIAEGVARIGYTVTDRRWEELHSKNTIFETLTNAAMRGSLDGS